MIKSSVAAFLLPDLSSCGAMDEGRVARLSESDAEAPPPQTPMRRPSQIKGSPKASAMKASPKGSPKASSKASPKPTASPKPKAKAKSKAKAKVKTDGVMKRPSAAVIAGPELAPEEEDDKNDGSGDPEAEPVVKKPAAKSQKTERAADHGLGSTTEVKSNGLTYFNMRYVKGGVVSIRIRETKSVIFTVSRMC